MQEQDYYELTQQQKGIWYTEKLYPETSIGIVAGTLRLNTDVNFSVLENAINKFIKNNDAMQLRITEKAGNPVQYINSYEYEKIEFVDFSDKDINELYAWEEEQARIPFDFFDSPLFKFIMFKVSDNDGGFLIKTHHIISDAWSMMLLSSKIVEIYCALLSESYTEKKAPSYLDYIEKEKQYFASKRYEQDRIYWQDKLKKFEDITTLKENKSDNTSIIANRKTFLVPEKLSRKMKDFCKENKTSEYTLFLAALAMYIKRTMDKDSMFFGTSLLNRTTADEKNTMGMFTSAAVPVYAELDDNMNFSDLISTISKELLSVFKHQKFPYSEIIKSVNKTKLFDIVLNYQNAKLDRDVNMKYFSRWNFSGTQIESLIININDRDGEGKLIIDYDYLAELFYAKEIDFIHKHIINILWHALDNPMKKIADLEMLSEEEKNKILTKFNKNTASYNKNITVHQIFEERVKEYPDNTAVTFNDKSITYRELNEKANSLARILRNNGLKRQDIVCIILDKSINTIISILAILKAGGAYLPILPDYPLERINFMLEDSASKFLITEDKYLGIYNFNGNIISVDDDANYTEDKSNLPNINLPTDLIYIIYTSGSTGKPKGVMLEHYNIVRLLFNSEFQFDFSANDVWTMFHSYCFDFSVWEMYGALLYGGRLVIIPKEISRDIQKFTQILKDENVTVLNQTPNVFYNLINNEIKYSDSQLKVRYVIFGGEALKPTMLKPFRSKYPSTKLINMYGITETTVHVTFKELSDSDINNSKSNIGKPIPTLKTYIMDKNLKLLPVNIPGEICVSGAGVARGYLNRPELTKEKFVTNPYNPDEILYRSGDLGRFYAQGDIEYLGRIDNQVKIRGFRVELEEIERIILTFSGVKNVLVMAKRDSNEKSYLCAYVVADKEIPLQKLREHLLKTLPDYMVPSYFVFLDKFPLTVNGKINRKELPEPIANDETEYVAPRTETEIILANIWSDVLSKEKVGIYDNLFHIGGDSLTVIQLLTRLYKYNWKLSANDFYEYPTVEKLAAKIDGDEKLVILDENEELIKPLKLDQVSSIDKNQKLSGNILLTGATGFLGIHILKELMSTTDNTIYCLVRGRDSADSLERLKKTAKFYFNDEDIINNRVIVMNGDITKEKFGLSEDNYNSIGHNVKNIIHTAALVKYYGDYNDFYNINVNGVKHVVEFAKKYNLKLNHISTIGISGSYLVECDKNGLVLTEEDLYVGQNYKDNVYVRSKFEAEKLIINAEHEGLNSTIFRMGNLTGRQSDGHFQTNMNDNAFNNIIKSVVLLKTVPESLLEEDVEFTPIDLAAKAVVAIANTQESNNRIFHITNFKELKFKYIMKMLEKLDMDIKVVSNLDFQRFVKEISANTETNKSLVGIIADMSKNQELSYDIPVKVKCDITEKYLKLLDFEWPEITFDYVNKVIQHLKERNFFEY